MKMKKTFDRILNLILHGINGTPFDFYIYIIFFFAEVLCLMVGSGIFGIFESYQHEILNAEKYMGLLIIGYSVLYSIAYVLKHRRVDLSTCALLSVVFFGIACLSTLLALGKELAYDYFTKLALLELFTTVVFMYNTASKLSEAQFRKLLRICGKGTVYLVLFLNAISLICYFIPHPASIELFNMTIRLPSVYFDIAEYRQYERYYGFYWHTNTLGTHCYLAVVLSIYFFKRKELNIVTFIAVLASCLFLTAVSRSRTGILVMAFIGAFSLYQWVKSKTSKRILGPMLGIAVILVLALGVIVVGPDKIPMFIETLRQDPYAALNSVSSDRMHILVTVIDMVKQSPLFGAGWNVQILTHDSAHNVFLTVIAWTGVVGILVFVMMFVFTIVNGIKTRSFKTDPWLWCIAASIFLHCMFEQGMIGDQRHAYTYLFWLVFGYLAMKKKADRTA